VLLLATISIPRFQVSGTRVYIDEKNDGLTCLILTRMVRDISG
jgi:hypothetical protein